MSQNIAFTGPGKKYSHIANAGTHVVKATAGLLDHVIVNGGSVGATCAIYDQNTTATGTVAVGTITLGGTAEIASPFSLTYGALTNTGIVAVTAGTIDLTFIYN